ncbi:MAG: RNA-binding protein [Bacteroidales bacterium]|jgi:RNA recognition motif-containing protein|nr:RNA-binding protein [Bacteroidales bacterium]
MNIFVAKLNFKTTSEDVQALFEQFGTVSSAKVIIDKLTNRSKGFGFVEMPDDDQAYEAISALNETEVDGNTIVVKKARPKTEGQGGGGYPRREGGGGYQQRREGGDGGGYRNRY